MARNQNAPRGKTGGRVGWIIFAIIAYSIYKGINGSDDAAPETGSESVDPSTTPQDVADTGAPAWAAAAGDPALPYAEAALRDNWPPLGAHQNSDAAAATAHGAQTIESNYYVVLDGSGSMRRSECSDGRPKIEVAVKALATFIESVPADANLGLAVFDDKGLKERVTLGVGNREPFREALRRVKVNGGTPLASSIQLAYDKLTEQAARQLGYGEYHLVMVTDGYPDPASEDPTDVVAELLRGSPVVLHTIGFCLGEDHVLNQPGRVYYTPADSPETLQQGLGSVLAEAPSFDVTSFPAP